MIKQKTKRSTASMYKQLKRLPRAFENIASAGTKRHVEGVKNVLIEGIKKGNLVQPRLSSATLQIRRALNRKGSSIPLVGRKKGMIDSLRVKKDRTKWTMYPYGFMVPEPIDGFLKQKRVSWKKLWWIHEEGVKINVTKKMRAAFAWKFGINLRRSKTTIDIPGRHAIRKAVNRYLRSQANKENDQWIIERIKRKIS